MRTFGKGPFKPLTSAICLALGISLQSGAIKAEVYTFTFGPGASNPIDLNDVKANDGLMTALDPFGVAFSNESSPYYYDSTWGYGNRTQITGSLTFDTVTMVGSGVISPFSFFFSGSPAIVHGMVLSNAGIDPNTGHQLMLGSMFLDLNGSNNLPVEIIWDVSGIVDASSLGINVGDVITNGAIPASDDIRKSRYPIGPSPIATTTWNIGADGVFPLIDDGIGGSPLREGPFTGFNINFDMSRVIVGEGIVDILDIDIDSAEGNVAECTGFDGSAVHYTATISGDAEDPVTNIVWSVDGSMVATGIAAELSIPLGSHTVTAIASTAEGREASDSEDVRVLDSVAPDISAELIDSKTGLSVSEVTTESTVEINMSATDVCDPNPEILGTAGFVVEANNSFTATKNQKSVSISSSVDSLNFIVTANDSSGNIATENLTLHVVDKKDK